MSTRLLFCSLIFIFLCTNQSEATHVMGGHISWQALGNDSFKVLLTYYRDCNGKQQDSTTLMVKTQCLQSQIKMTLASKQDVTPVCNNQCSRCTDPTCSYSYGVQKVTLAGIFSTAKIINKGCCEVNLVWSVCCRYASTSAPTMYLKATMNTCDGRNNSSPVMSYNPPSIMCFGIDQSFSYAASDSDADSIRYELSPSMQDSSTQFPYNSGRSYYRPIYFLGYPKGSAATPRGFHFNKRMGSLKFRPMAVEQGVISVTIKEYKNGVVVSALPCDMRYIVTQCASNSAPTISGINCKNRGSVPDTVEICPFFNNKMTFCTNDKDADDSVTLSWGHEIDNATFTLLNAGSRMENARFEWVPKASDIRDEPYVVTLIAEDHSCPNSNRTVKSFFIIVKDIPPTPDISVKTNTCGQLILTGKSADSTYSAFNWGVNNQFDSKSHYGTSTQDTLNTKISGKTRIDLYIRSLIKLPSGLTKWSCANYAFDSIDIPVHPALIANDTNACSTDSVRLKAYVKHAKPCCPPTIWWSTGKVDTNRVSTLDISGKNTGDVWVKMRDGACTDSAHIYIDLLPVPEVSLSKSWTLCEGKAREIKPSVSSIFINQLSDLQFVWRKSGDTATLSTDTNLLANDTGYYNLSVSNKWHCSLLFNTKLAYHNHWIANDTSLCQNNWALLKLPAEGDTRYHWLDKWPDTSVYHTGNTRSVALAQARRFYVERLLGKGNNKCSSIDSFVVDTIGSPQVSVSPKMTDVCTGAYVLLSADKAGGQWQGPGIFANSQKITYQADSLNLGLNLVFYSIENAQGCKGNDTSFVRIWRQPKSRIKPGDTVVQLGSTRSFSNAGYSGVNPQYVWISSLPANSGTNDSFNLTFNQLGISHLQLIVTDDLTGCGDTSTLTIHIEKSVWDGKQQDQKPEIYPNPGSGMVQIDHVATTSQLRVISISGAVVCSKTLHPGFNSIDMSYLPEGVYLYRIANPSAESKGKLVIVR